MKNMTNYRNTCPICGYSIKPPKKYPALGCQCRFGGSAHPDRSKRMDVVFSHLYLLHPKQVKHVIKLQKYFQMSYIDDEKEAIVKELGGRQ